MWVYPGVMRYLDGGGAKRAEKIGLCMAHQLAGGWDGRVAVQEAVGVGVEDATVLAGLACGGVGQGAGRWALDQVWSAPIHPNSQSEPGLRPC